MKTKEVTRRLNAKLIAQLMALIVHEVVLTASSASEV
jgi:hypothetical protein